MRALTRRRFVAGGVAAAMALAMQRIEKILGANLVRVFSDTWKG